MRLLPHAMRGPPRWATSHESCDSADHHLSCLVSCTPPSLPPPFQPSRRRPPSLSWEAPICTARHACSFMQPMVRFAACRTWMARCRSASTARSSSAAIHSVVTYEYLPISDGNAHSEEMAGGTTRSEDAACPLALWPVATCSLIARRTSTEFPCFDCSYRPSPVW